MLRFFDVVELIGASSAVTYVFKHVWRTLTKREPRVVVRLLAARPLWWLAARLLAVPDASARYVEFRKKALTKWEDFLLGR